MSWLGREWNCFNPKIHKETLRISVYNSCSWSHCKCIHIFWVSLYFWLILWPIIELLSIMDCDPWSSTVILKGFNRGVAFYLHFYILLIWTKDQDIFTKPYFIKSGNENAEIKAPETSSLNTQNGNAFDIIDNKSEEKMNSENRTKHTFLKQLVNYWLIKMC